VKYTYLRKVEEIYENRYKLDLGPEETDLIKYLATSIFINGFYLSEEQKQKIDEIYGKLC